MKKNSVFIFLFTLFIAFPLSGCGKQEPVPTVTDVSKTENIPAQGDGIIRGKVNYTGKPAEASSLDMAADPVCSGAHSGPVPSEEITVNSNGTLRDVFVYISEGVPSGAYPVPSQAVILNQEGCRYTPHVFGIRAGQTLTLQNDDPTLHNVHLTAQNSKEFNVGMPLKGMKVNKRFDAPEVMAHLKCDVHPWMSAYAGVLDHPFFTVTGEDGTFEIKGLPRGTYQLRIWQEKLGVQNVPVDVTAQGVSEVIINYGN